MSLLFAEDTITFCTLYKRLKDRLFIVSCYFSKSLTKQKGGTERVTFLPPGRPGS